MLRTNDIPLRQNEPRAIQRQAAAEALFRRSARFFYLQTVLGVLIPVALAVLNLVLSQLSVPQPQRQSIAAWFALYGFLMLLLDEFLLDPGQQGAKRRGAVAREMFDVQLFQLPWNATKVHPQPDDAELAEQADKTLRQPASAARMRNWYAPIVGEVPIELGRLICQRTNLWWDSKLRHSYSWGFGTFAGSLVILGLLVAKVLVLNIDGALLGAITIGPALRWAIREGKRHAAVKGTQERLSNRACELQNAFIEDRIAPEDVTSASRELQDAIYDLRATAPIGIRWIYLLSRKRFETGMSVNAEKVVRDYKARHPE